MAIVKAIPPHSKEPPLKKGAAYCCVSTKSQEQLDSVAAQECYEIVGNHEAIIVKTI